MLNPIHPSKQQLLAYAESLVGHASPICGATAGHVGRCAKCKAEIEAMRATFCVTHAAQDLEPSREFTANIVLAARHERQAIDRRWARFAAAGTFTRGLAFASSIAAIAGLVYTLDLPKAAPRGEIAPQAQAATPIRMEMYPYQAPQLPSHAEEVLTAAIMSPKWQPQTHREKQQLRKVQVMGDDMSAAQAALARNPYSLRATQVVKTAREQRVQEMKSLYVERSL